MNPDKLARAERDKQNINEAGPGGHPGDQHLVKLVITIGVEACSQWEAIDLAADWAEDLKLQEEILDWKFHREDAG